MSCSFREGLLVSIKKLIEKFEAEAAAIQAKINALNERATLVETMVKELRKSLGSHWEAAMLLAKQVKETRKPRKARKPRKTGKMTVRDAIMKVVAAADGSLAVKDILGAAADHVVAAFAVHLVALDTTVQIVGIGAAEEHVAAAAAE